MASRNKRKRSTEIHLGFQIAPMIDVVFVIMLFFMVMAGQVQKEQELKLKLPGRAIASEEVEAIEETQIRVLESGDVLLNDEPMGAPDDARLVEMTATLIRLKQASDDARSKVVCTIVADEQAPFQRVVDVLNALSVARIANVTFEVPAA
jgi:biopolymer transport protein ExbD